MRECPNCGHKSYTGSSRCACLWSEQIRAMRRRAENERRERADREKITLEEWLDRWEAEVLAGQSTISREEATRRYYREHPSEAT